MTWKTGRTDKEREKYICLRHFGEKITRNQFPWRKLAEAMTKCISYLCFMLPVLPCRQSCRDEAKMNSCGKDMTFYQNPDVGRGMSMR